MIIFILFRTIWILNIIGASICYHNLLFATSRDIRMGVLSRPKKVYTVIKDLSDAVAIDYLYDESLLCWTDHGLEMIQCAIYNGTYTSNKKTIVRSGISSPDGLACDWLTRKLYWTDGGTNRIEVVSLDTKYRKVLFWQELDQPRGIAVDPLIGIMFWTDWGEVPKIEKASMDGSISSRSIIVSENIFWPNSISLDINSKQLYWLDGKYHFIEVTDYNGQSRKTLAEKGLLYPFSLSIYNDRIYWSDWKTLSIYTLDRKVGSQPQEIIHGDYIPMDVKVWDASRQPYRHNPCEQNGGCSHLCLLSVFSPGYSCACPTGIKLKTNNTCALRIEHFLLLVQRSEISKISLDSPDHTNIVIPLKGIKHAVGIAFDYLSNTFFWTDDESRSISKAKLDGTDQTELITADISNPDGISVDWLARNIYWSDTAINRIEVARLDGKYRKVLIVDDLGKPRAVAVSPFVGWIFWSDWNEKTPKIERADLDGSNRIIIIRNGISWPNGIALDDARKKFYWADAKLDKIEVVNMDGTDRIVILSENVPHIFGLSLLGDYLYWTDWQRRSIDRVNKYTGADRQIILDQLPNVMGLKAVEIKDDKGWSPCRESNGNCTQLCLTRPNNQYACACEIGYELSDDNKTCIYPEAFIILAEDTKIRRISLEHTYNSDTVIPLIGIKSVSAVDVDPNNMQLYWSDIKLKVINKAFLNGSQPEKVIDFGLQSPESIAVDWITKNIYWIDVAKQRIEVCKNDGTIRKVLFWYILKEPKNLVLNPFIGYMFWSEWDGKGSIIKGAMNGKSHSVIATIIGKITGLTIDYETQRLYWSYDNDGISAIFTSDFNGNDEQQIFANSNRYMPVFITLSKNFIYWLNWNDGSIIAGRKLTGEIYNTLYVSSEHVTDLKIVHLQKNFIKNSCDHNKCSHLCLTSSNSDLLNHMSNCSCPTHYKFINGTCEGPQDFILIAQKSAISRIIMDTIDCPESPFTFPALKNIRAIEYDPVEKFLYWIDSKAQAIKRGYENGSLVGVFLDGGLSTTQYNNFFDIALDPYNRLLFWSCSTTDSIHITRLNNSTLGIIYKAHEGEKPRYIGIHPEKSILFWIDLGIQHCIIRARYDGQKRSIIASDLKNIEAFSIDRVDDLLFLAQNGMIYSCDLQGNNKKVVISTGTFHIVSLTVMHNYIYWVDKSTQYITRTNKFTGDNRTSIATQFSQVSDLLTVITPSADYFHLHPCSSVNNFGSCSHLCIVSPTNNSSSHCSCPIGLSLNEDHMLCLVLPTCGRNHFTCSTGGECISAVWKCDGQTDCPDSSDEVGCSVCEPHSFRCHSGQCIDINLVCDGIQQCIDGSDETILCTNIPSAIAHENSNLIVSMALLLVVVCLIISSVFLCGYKSKCNSSTALNDAYDNTVLRPLTLYKSNNSKTTSLTVQNSVNIFTMGVVGVNSGGGGSSSGGSNDRSYFAGVSSTSNVCYPLNPPPSPATIMLRNDRCCHIQSLQTPCSTDVCDDSDSNYKSNNTHIQDSEAYYEQCGCNISKQQMVDSSTYVLCDNENDGVFSCKPPPPTPCSNSSEPPSPSPSSVYFRPSPPPPPSPCEKR